MPSPPSARAKVKRYNQLASYDAETIHAILDAMPLCHVGYVFNGSPYPHAATARRQPHILARLRRQPHAGKCRDAGCVHHGQPAGWAGDGALRLQLHHQLPLGDAVRQARETTNARSSSAAAEFHEQDHPRPVGQAAPGEGQGAEGNHRAEHADYRSQRQAALRPYG